MTAELAVALPAVVLSAAGVVAVSQAALAQLDCVDAARAGARAAARGDSAARVQQVARDAAGGGTSAITVEASGPEVAVTVRRQVRLVLPHGPSLEISARASAEAEMVAERGSATVLATAVVAVAALLALMVAALGGVVVARHRAAGAADLAALAAAGASAGSPGEACSRAQAVARRNGARLTACDLDALTSTVEVAVSVRPPGAVGRLGEAVSRARAGPRQGSGARQGER